MNETNQNNETVVSPITSTAQDFGLKIFREVRDTMLIKTDWVYRSNLSEAVKTEYEEIRQWLRDLTPLMDQKMAELGYEFVTDAWVKEQIVLMLTADGKTVYKEFSNRP